MDLQWKFGDILFLGDSLTDFARIFHFDPLRTFNAGILSARISDVHYVLTTIENHFASKPASGLFPSRVVILVGTNDLLHGEGGTFNIFSNAAKNAYYTLFALLRSVRNRYGCQIVFRSILPGDQISPSECPAAYIQNKAAFNAAVIEANNFLKQSCSSPANRFIFADDYDVFWDPGTQGLHPAYGTNFPNDYLHLGCWGYQVAIARLVPRIYDPFQTVSSNFYELPPEPSAVPKSTKLLVSGMSYRYGYVMVPQSRTLSFTVSGSSYNYAGIYDNSLPGGYPHMDQLSQTGTSVTSSFYNKYGVDYPVVLCMGTHDNSPGSYSLLFT